MRVNQSLKRPSLGNCHPTPFLKENMYRLLKFKRCRGFGGYHVNPNNPMDRFKPITAHAYPTFNFTEGTLIHQSLRLSHQKGSRRHLQDGKMRECAEPKVGIC